MICASDVTLDRVYKFTYDGRRRLAVPTVERGQDLLTCWDFTRDAYRTFDFSTVQDVEDVTAACIVTEDTDRVFASDVTTKELNGLVFAVKFAR